MKKRFRLNGLHCANCAAKIEAAISKLDGVTSCTVNFLTQSLSLEGDDANFDVLVQKAAATCSKVEPDCSIRL